MRLSERSRSMTRRTGLTRGPQRPAAQHSANRTRAALRPLRGLDRALRRAAAYAHPAARIVRRETHISTVYLAGRFAYKRKKPVAFDFVNFTDARDRMRSCAAELLLNRALAAPLYLGLQRYVRPGRAWRAARAHDTGGEWLVRMRRFDERMLFSRLLAEGELRSDDIDQAAARLAAFHLHAPQRIPRQDLGSAQRVRAQVDAVLAGLTAQLGPATTASLRRWCSAELARLGQQLDVRRASGYVRGCHGDMHLINVVRWRNTVAMFDCIEFDYTLRWIDVASDLAFLLMDLRAHGRADLAARLLNRWLDITGDYGALRPLRLFIVYRALVRAYVACLAPPQQRQAMCERYLRTAVEAAGDATDERPRCLMLCHGVSGSGKSVASRALANLYPAIRLSSDAQRKRPHALGASGASPLNADAYTTGAMDAVYRQLLELARQTLQAGYSTIVDATFLGRGRRASFIELARQLKVPVVLLEFVAGDACLQNRLAARTAARRDLSDADLAVLATQRRTAEPFTDSEAALAVTLDTEVPRGAFESAAYWHAVFERARAAGNGVGARPQGGEKSILPPLNADDLSGRRELYANPAAPRRTQPRGSTLK